MSGDLRAGSVFVSFSASTSEWTKGLNEAIKSTDKFLKDVEGIGGKLGGIGAQITAGLGLSIAALKDSSPQAAAAFEAVKESTTALANEVITAALPAIQAISSAVISVTEAIRGMDSETKGSIANFGAWAVGGMLLAGVLGKVAAAGSGLLGVAKMLGPVFAAIGSIGLGPILAIGAALAALATTAAIVYEAWHDTSTGFQESILAMVEALKGWGRALVEWFSGVFKSIGGLISKAFDGYLDLVAAQIRGLATIFGTIAEMLPDDLIPKGVKEFIADASNVTGTKLKAGLVTGAKAVVDGLKTGAGLAADAIRTSVDYASRGFERIGRDLEAKFGGLFKGGSLAGRGSGEATDLKKLFGATTGQLSGAQGDALGRAIADSLEQQRIDAFGPEIAGLGDIGKEIEKGAKVWQDAAKDSADAIQDAMGGLASKFMSRTGAVSGVVDSASQGAAAGGPIGAIAAVLIDLVTQSETFQTAVEMSGTFLSTIANTLGQVLLPVLPILGSAFTFVGNLFTQLTPIIEMIASVLEPFSAVLEVLFTALAPLLNALVQLLGFIIKPITQLVNVALRGFFEVIKYLSLGVMFIVKGIASVWNGLLSGVQAVLNFLGNIKIFGARPFGFLSDWADGLERAKITTGGLDAAMTDLADLSYEEAKAKAAANAETWKTKKAMESFGESLTNVPEGFKYSLRRFESAMAEDGTVGGGVNVGSTTTPLTVPPPAITDNSSTSIVISLPPAAVVAAQNPEALASAIVAEIENSRQRRHGNFFASDSTLWQEP